MHHERVGERDTRQPGEELWNERDAKFFSFVDTDGFTTVYRMNGYKQPTAVDGAFQADRDIRGVLPWIQPLLLRIQQDFQEFPNHCVITRYDRLYDSIGAHRDKTQDLLSGSSVFIVTVGEPRDFTVMPRFKAPGARQRSKATRNFKPASGSLLRLSWETNQAYEHAVPLPAAQGKSKLRDGLDLSTPGLESREYESWLRARYVFHDNPKQWKKAHDAEYRASHPLNSTDSNPRERMEDWAARTAAIDEAGYQVWRADQSHVGDSYAAFRTYWRKGVSLFSLFSSHGFIE